MQKFMLGCFFSVISIAIASTASVTSVNAQTAGTSATNTSQSMTTAEYLDNMTPQVIEKISGNIVTFKNASGASNNYYVPSWMFARYNLKVGTSTNLYNRNVIQGIYRGSDSNRDSYGYIDVVSQGLPYNTSAFTIHETERRCTSADTKGLGVGMRVWYRAGDCPSAIPVVGSMSFYEPKSLASSEPSDRRSNVPSTTDMPTRTDMPSTTMDRPTPSPSMTR